MISLDFFDSSSKYGVVKATVHKTGKLGFSSGAAKLLDLENIRYFNIGKNKANSEDESLYLVPIEDESDKSFKVVKAGDYFYVFIKNIMREMKIDYKNESVIFDIEELSEFNLKYYKMTRRERK